MAATRSGSGGKLDIATIGGIAIALGGMLAGLLLEGGRVKDVAQITAALIVLSGTFGAVMVSTPLSVLRGALRRFASILVEKPGSPIAVIDEIIGYAAKARKSGLVSLEQEASQIKDPFLKKALNLAVDGTDMQELRNMMELEIEMQESRARAEAKVFESAGGYAPTIGIIGAVMGLIQVMKNLANIEEVGHGIAVAFVATVYGVGIANILLIPASVKIRIRIEKQVQGQELMLEGVIGIVEGLNPKLIRSKLEAYLEKTESVPKTESAPKKVKAPVPEKAAPEKIRGAAAARAEN
jgi:chemotaxis protein MotA